MNIKKGEKKWNRHALLGWGQDGDGRTREGGGDCAARSWSGDGDYGAVDRRQLEHRRPGHGCRAGRVRVVFVPNGTTTLDLLVMIAVAWVPSAD